MTGPDPLDAAAGLDGLDDVQTLDDAAARYLAGADWLERAAYDPFDASNAADDENRADLDALAALDGADGLDDLDPDEGPTGELFDEGRPPVVFVCPYCGLRIADISIPAAPADADTWHRCVPVLDDVAEDEHQWADAIRAELDDWADW